MMSYSNDFLKVVSQVFPLGVRGQIAQGEQLQLWNLICAHAGLPLNEMIQTSSVEDV